MTTSGKVPGGDALTTSQARVLLDADGVIIEWSGEAEALLGHRREEMVGRPLSPLLVRPEPDEEGGVPQAPPVSGGCRVRLRDRSGLPVDVEWWMCPHISPKDPVTWAVFLAATRGADPGDFDRAVLDALLTESPMGLHVLDTELRLVRFNTASPGMRDVRAEDVIGRPAREVAPTVVTDTVEHLLRHVLSTGEPVIDFVQPGYPPADPQGEHLFSLSAFRLRNRAGEPLGVASLAIDVTERYRYRARLELLNDASMRIGTSLDLARTAEELAETVVGRVADAVSVDVLDSVYRGEAPEPGPVPAEVTFRRTAFRVIEASGLQPAYAIGEKASYGFPTPLTQCLADLRPRLIPKVNDDDTWLAHDPLRADRMRAARVHSMMVVPLAARGVVLGVASFYRSVTHEPFDEDDLTIVGELAAHTALGLDNARRYTREHTAALVLQNSLLPGRLPDQNAVEAAFSYLPGHAGGPWHDVPWYDVIPLSGARIALVVGDVAGHGMRAVATMGRLRAATHSLAALDLTPDEVLAHLDDLMVRLAEEGRLAAANDPLDVQPTTATCAYAVYDPVSRHLVVARAGHPTPLLAHPDGHVASADAPAGPPLGGDGLPFETWDTRLPEGTLIALYTEGLVRRSPDEAGGVARLRCVLAQQHACMREACDAVIYSQLSGRAAEDIVLLLARTCVLNDDQVASWTFPSDPAIVATARTLADRQLTSWGLSELAFTTEVIVSELVTNAIRYAPGTIQVRLIRDRALICEVTDGSSAAPYLRHPRTTDEGGRGLLLVAQLTDRWGTRHTRRGKTIWTEQPLPTHPDGTVPVAPDR
ncbi:SpoIIE family protein phosphatase [Streptomyces mirabilis]|uniref:PAS domain S-box-containing protein n=1 Tax=Streptomyces mirabilis TaxID=68239 RepID=A0A1I2TXB0_9ACTN|nr:SpoIIE family protein phosphatase [Streptomyces mirabilis]SFG69530.1 PAS domain S-box-containing protein [Streptomyces mirabilis]